MVFERLWITCRTLLKSSINTERSHHTTVFEMAALPVPPRLMPAHVYNVHELYVWYCCGTIWAVLLKNISDVNFLGLHARPVIRHLQQTTGEHSGLMLFSASTSHYLGDTVLGTGVFVCEHTYSNSAVSQQSS